MKKLKNYRCKVCGQLVAPNPDGSCPICGAPKELLVFAGNRDDEEYETQKRR